MTPISTPQSANALVHFVVERKRSTSIISTPQSANALFYFFVERKRSSSLIFNPTARTLGFHTSSSANARRHLPSTQRCSTYAEKSVVRFHAGDADESCYFAFVTTVAAKVGTSQVWCPSGMQMHLSDVSPTIIQYVTTSITQTTLTLPFCTQALPNVVTRVTNCSTFSAASNLLQHIMTRSSLAGGAGTPSSLETCTIPRPFLPDLGRNSHYCLQRFPPIFKEDDYAIGDRID
ncbi:hypothetical protein CY34DRAFT_16594 [Suillus luteus UH-Slu-Lm8-n1]|uniref:Uncharacterized protein n=1 Tax=Suillus luteus UH-Slu-Lm8-n1 TaxID=930992 RepID=A0A0D0A350_9AGAM|nr:hypothetical protein CY34DRAFT_16594 [Suillus luteus UH-Slu-Lm8-n1]